MWLRRNLFDTVALDHRIERERELRIEVLLGNLQDDDRTNHPVIKVLATIEENDRVTPGSQFVEEFALSALTGYLDAVRDDRLGVEDVELHEDVETGDPLRGEQANELDRQDQEAELEASKNAADDLALPSQDSSAEPVDADQADENGDEAEAKPKSRKSSRK